MPESGNMLSQRREYAEDGRGLSVGIDSNLLSKTGNSDEDDPISSSRLYFDKIAQDTIRELKYITEKYKKSNKDNRSILLLFSPLVKRWLAVFI